MIVESLKSMITFIGLLFMVITMFGVMNFLVDHEYYDRSKKYHNGNFHAGPLKGKAVPHPEIFESIGNQYQVIFGENPEIKYEMSFWANFALYWLFTVGINVIMMNLLISIVSDVHDKTQSQNISTCIKARCQILQETGVFLSVFVMNFFP